tara:strand:+ start:717 stop:929 length:213 start_codon:yes stop_codon:yes gene_type:complete
MKITKKILIEMIREEIDMEDDGALGKLEPELDNIVKDVLSRIDQVAGTDVTLRNLLISALNTKLSAQGAK